MLRAFTNVVRLHMHNQFFFSANIREQRSPIIRETEGILPFTFNHLWDNEGARHTTKRLGRGNGSGKGNSCGKGQRGQKARASVGIRPQLEGGQTPLQRRLPKWGTKPHKDRFNEVNMQQILYAIWKGRIDPTQTITIKAMQDAGLFKRVKFGVKILARGVEQLKFMEQPLHFEVSDASGQSIKAIKERGGSVTCIYRTPLLIKEHVKPEKFDLQLRDPIPPAHYIPTLLDIKERGAEVIYRKPNWQLKAENKDVKVELSEEEKKQAEGLQATKKELKKRQKKPETEEQLAMLQELKDFQFPAKREPGCGENKIRKRKALNFRKIDYKL